MRSKKLASLGITTVVALSLLYACGGGDSGPAATFRGNVSSVLPAQAMIDRPDHRWLARASSLLLPEAIAQSSCPAKNVLVCANNGQHFFCLPVNKSDCDFTVEINARDDFAEGSVFFVNDANKNGRRDESEGVAVLTNPLGRVCNGTVVHLDNVDVSFTAGFATAASVDKDPNTCGSATPTRTPGGPTPTRTPTGATPTPTTYMAANSLNQPPSTMLAFLSGAGVVGLLLPTRRRKRRK